MSPEETGAYIDLIESIHRTVREDDPNIWWPTVIERSINQQGIHVTQFIINGKSASAACMPDCIESDPNQQARRDGFNNALLRLTLNPSLQCALYVYHIKALKFKAQKSVLEDLLIGFVKGSPQDQLTIIPILNGTHIYPLIGMSYDCNTPDIPKDTEWVLAAQLQTDARHAFSRYNQYVQDISRFLNVAPTLNPVNRPGSCAYPVNHHMK